MTATDTPTFAPDWISPPGETIEDILEERDMSQADLARRLGLTPKYVNQLIHGTASISAPTALGLEKVLGASAAFWLRREAQYRADLAVRNELSDFQGAQKWASKFPCDHLKKHGFLSQKASGTEEVRELLRFFRIASPAEWACPAATFRKAEHLQSDQYSLSAWLQMGALRAEEIDCAPYEKTQFAKVVQEIRTVTRMPVSTWLDKLVEVCATVGVAVVVSEEFPGTRANGATYWIAPHKAVIQLTTRNRWEDVFWFSFFHEAGHILLHGKKQVFVEDGASNVTDPGVAELEREADRFAAQCLIPRRFESRLKALTLIQAPAFAEEIGVSPAIVVGRMHHEGLLPYNRGNKLRSRIHISHE